MMESSTKTGFAALALLLISGCDSDNKVTTAAPLDWQICEATEALQCSTLEVPMIHGDAGGEKITLALNRLPATGTTPLGSLVFNPGGPGGSGLQLIEALQQDNIVPDAIRAAYHLVSFDPRGVGQSTPIDCEEDGVDNLDDYPVTLAELQAIERGITAYATTCFEKIGDYLLHVGSRAVVRDMELIRQSLSEPTLNFLGYSYGTRLAALYAQDYPAKVGRFILDGSLPPTHDTATLFGASLPAMEANLLTLADSCSQFSSCDPATYKQALESRVQTLIDNGGELELQILSRLVIGAVQSPEMIPAVAQALYDYSLAWNAGSLLQIADDLDLGGNGDDDGDSITMEFAVLCADDASRPTATDAEALRDDFNQRSDIFAELQLASALTCAGWPGAVDPLPEISTSQAPPTLVIGGPTDTQTILPWSEQMATAIGGHFLRSEHLGHTTVFSRQNQCTDAAAIDFLLNGTLPDKTVCAADL